MDLPINKPNGSLTLPNTPKEVIIEQKEVFQCPYPDCNYESKWKQNVVKHEKRHHPSAHPDLSCRFCTQNHSSLVSFFNHMSSRHSKQLSCPSCSFIGQEFSEFKAHVLGHCKTERHKFSFPFPNCNYTVSHSQFLQAHIQTRHEINPGIEITIQEKQDQDSQVKALKGRGASWSCDKWSYKTSLAHNMRSHTRVHSCEKLFKCPNPGCNYKGHWARGLQVHQRSCRRGNRRRSLQEVYIEKIIKERSAVNWMETEARVEAAETSKQIIVHADHEKFSYPVSGRNYRAEGLTSVRSHSADVHNIDLLPRKPLKTNEDSGSDIDCEKNTELNVQSSSRMAFACMLCEFVGDSETSAWKHARQHKTVVVP